MNIESLILKKSDTAGLYTMEMKSKQKNTEYKNTPIESAEHDLAHYLIEKNLGFHSQPTSIENEALVVAIQLQFSEAWKKSYNDFFNKDCKFSTNREVIINILNNAVNRYGISKKKSYVCLEIYDLASQYAVQLKNQRPDIVNEFANIETEGKEFENDENYSILSTQRSSYPKVLTSEIIKNPELDSLHTKIQELLTKASGLK
ncbi:MAG: hypothetical protein ACRCST_10690 [Turicibacter sp.]